MALAESMDRAQIRQEDLQRGQARFEKIKSPAVEKVKATGGLLKRIGDSARAGMATLRGMGSRIAEAGLRTLGATERIGGEVVNGIKNGAEALGHGMASAYESFTDTVGKGYENTVNTVHDASNYLSSRYNSIKVNMDFAPGIRSIQQQIDALHRDAASERKDDAQRLQAASGDPTQYNEVMENIQRRDEGRNERLSEMLGNLSSQRDSLVSRRDELMGRKAAAASAI